MIKKFIAVILAGLMMFFVGCQKTQEDHKILIVASFYPMYIFTKNLTDGIDEVTVANMTDQSIGCLHDYQLLTKDMKLLSNAKLFVINGAGMEGFMNKVLKQLPDLKIVDTSAGIELLSADDHDHEEHEEDTHEGHDHAYNSHVWMSVPNAMVQVENIYKALVKLMPQYTTQLQENYNRYSNTLTALNEEIHNSLAEVKKAPVITFHEAYEYFALEYGLDIVATIETDEGAEPGTAALAELVKIIKKNNISALFIEPENNGNSATILANETNAKLYTLNPIITGQDKLTAYEDTMRENTRIIKTAFSN